MGPAPRQRRTGPVPASRRTAGPRNLPPGRHADAGPGEPQSAQPAGPAGILHQHLEDTLSDRCFHRIDRPAPTDVLSTPVQVFDDLVAIGGCFHRTYPAPRVSGGLCGSCQRGLSERAHSSCPSTRYGEPLSLIGIFATFWRNYFKIVAL